MFNYDQPMSKKRRKELQTRATTAIILAILFVLISVSTLLLMNLENRLFDAPTYQTALNDSGVYDELPRLIAEQLHYAATFDACRQNPLSCQFPNATGDVRTCIDDVLGKDKVEAIIKNEHLATSKETQDAQDCFSLFGTPEQIETPPAPAPIIFVFFSTEQIESILTGITTPKALQDFTNEVIEQTLAITGGKALALSIPLDWLKDGLKNNGTDAIMQAISSQPECTVEQVLVITLQIALDNATNEFFMCSPSQELSLLMRPLIDVGIKAQATIIPRTLVFNAPSQLSGLKISIMTLRTIIRYSWILPTLLLAILTIVAVRTPKEWLRWWGVPLMFIGILSLLISVVSIPLFKDQILTLVSPNLPPYVLPEIVEITKNLILEILQNMLAPITIESIAISALGLIMLIISRFLRK